MKFSNKFSLRLALKKTRGFFVGAFEECYRGSQLKPELPEIRWSDDKKIKFLGNQSL